MSAEASSPTIKAGTGWRAEYFSDCIYLTIYSNASDDTLPVAVEALLPEPIRRHWLVEFAHEDSYGNDIWLLTQSR